MGPLDLLDQARRHTFMSLWNAGVAVRGVFATAVLPPEHGFPESVLPPSVPLVGLDFDPAWPMALTEDDWGLAADFVFGLHRCRCRLPWRSLHAVEAVGTGVVQFMTTGMEAPFPMPEQSSEPPVVEHEGNVMRVQFGRPRPEPVES